MLISPCTRSTRPRRQTRAIDVEHHVRAGIVFDDFGTGDRSLSRNLAFAADRARRAERRRRPNRHRRPRSTRCLLRARTSRFLRKSVRSLRFFFDMRQAAYYFPYNRFVGQLHLTGLHIGWVVPLAIVWITAAALQLAMIQSGAGQQGFVRHFQRYVIRWWRADSAEFHRDRNRRGTCAWRQQ